jgi:hypothetical protein
MTSLTALLNKLTEIEQSVGREDDHVLRTRIVEAQDCALRLQKELMDILLKESREKAAQLNTKGVSKLPS